MNLTLSNTSSTPGPSTDDFWFRQVTPLVIVFFGVIGNTFTILIFSKTKYAGISTCYYMNTLAVCDQLVMIMLLVRFVNNLPESPFIRDDWFCKLYFALNRVFRDYSAWILLFTSLDR